MCGQRLSKEVHGMSSNERETAPVAPGFGGTAAGDQLTVGDAAKRPVPAFDGPEAGGAHGPGGTR
jgi:hypothetical protein